MITNRYKYEQEAEECIQSIITKEAFENAEEAQKFVEAILFCRNQSKRNLKTLAQTIETNITTTLGSETKYIYELLQNADDACAKEVTIDIQTHRIAGQDRHSLLVSHSGLHFSPIDVEKICDNAQSSGNKTDNPNKTGYKGVGFKANFFISKRITIISNNICFRFDKSSFEPPENYPWQIMPLWTEKTDALSLLDPGQVHFLLDDINREKVEAGLDKIFSAPEVLLLLRNIDKVTLRHKNFEIVRTNNKKANLISLTAYNQGFACPTLIYQRHEFDIEIPEQLKIYLKTLSSSECPEKLKNTPKITITFAVAIDENQMPVSSPNARLYSYLPTDVKTALPFWVNADFLLTQDRGSLLDREWNQFLIYNIAKLQFEVLRRIAQNPSYHSCILDLLPMREIPASEGLSVFIESYRAGFDSGINTIDFIPSANGPLLRRQACIVDEHNFFKKEQGGFTKLPETLPLFNRCFTPEQHSKIISHQLGDADKIKRKLLLDRTQTFLASEITSLLPEYITLIVNNPEALTHLWKYLISASGDLLTALQKQPWIRLNSGQVKLASECFIPEDYALNDDLVDLDIIDASIFPDETILKNQIIEWLIHRLEVAQVNYLNIFKTHYPKIINDNRVDKSLAIKMLLNLFRHIDLTLPSDTSIISMLGKIFPIDTGVGKLAISQCLLPIFLLDRGAQDGLQQQRIPNEYFASEEYLHDSNKLRALLTAMGAKNSLEFTVYIGKKKFTEIDFTQPLLENYKDYCKEKYPAITQIFNAKPHFIRNFITCSFLDKIALPGYKETFWELLLKHFQSLTNVIYLSPNSTKQPEFKIISPILYALKNHKLITAINLDDTYTTGELYLLAYSRNITDFPFPVADIPENIPKEILKELGFKLSLTFEDAMTMLMNDRYQTRPTLKIIYTAILSNYEETNSTHRDGIKAYKKSYTFLTTNGDRQYAENIFWHNLSDGLLDDHNNIIDRCGLSIHDFEKMTIIFNIRPLSEAADLNLSFSRLEEADEEQQICSELKLNIFDFLAFATAYTVHHSSITKQSDYIHIAEKFYQQLCNLRLACYDNICLALSSLSLSDQEPNSQEDKEKVTVKKSHDNITVEIIFTKEAYENSSTRLIDELAKSIFEDEDLRKIFSYYMLNPKSINSSKKLIKELGSKDAWDFTIAYFDNALPEFQQQLSSTSSRLNHAHHAQPNSTNGEGFFSQSDADIPLISQHIAASDTQRPQSSLSFSGQPVSFWNGSISSATNRKTQRTNTNYLKNSRELIDAKKNIETGRLGEQMFYNFLLMKASAMFASIVPVEDGFNGFDEHGTYVLRVTWFNKINEQRKAIDFQVDFQDQSYFFEVKSTQCNTTHAFLSESERKVSEAYQDNYALVFVYTNRDTNNMHIRWNPSQKISEEIMSLIPTQYEIKIGGAEYESWGEEDHPTATYCAMS